MPDSTPADSTETGNGSQPRAPTLPAPTLPKGGGAIRGIGEKFSANPVSGAGMMNVPIATSPGRSGFGPSLTLAYDSSAGNGPYGLGWRLGLPAITRKTDKGMPLYRDAEEADTFILSGAEDLVPVLARDKAGWQRGATRRTRYGRTYRVVRYRPRIEGLFACIERWTNVTDASDMIWRSISTDNTTTWYGLSAAERIADPDDPAKIFSWLISETYDGKGNVIAYRYKAEDSQGLDLRKAHEANRTAAQRSAHRYLKHILYGNRTPYYPDPGAARPIPLPTDWHFEVLFDYGEHDDAVPLPDVEVRPWPERRDPFSTYRATFEVRTYRRCRRVLMFHHFPEESGVGANCLVRSTYLAFADPTELSDPIYSFLASVTQKGYRRRGDGYLASALPPVEFDYSRPVIDPTLRDIDPESLENLPAGLDGEEFRWVDLDGEGSSGILARQADAWFYKANWSAAHLMDEDGAPRARPRFGPLTMSRLRPVAGTLPEQAQFLDLAGSGHLDLVDLESADPGFYERQDGGWRAFTAFRSRPEIDWADPNLHFVDVTGDGLIDVLLGDENAFLWFASRGRAGFSPGERTPHAFDEERGPAVMFADSAESIFLADMSGDGLADVVRIRNGEVCYWPNLGYGRFGAKVVMDRAPRFDTADLFDARRIRLVDLDGSGTADIVYFGTRGASLHFNLSGNGWGPPFVVPDFPPVDTVTAAHALDLLGTGTACLVWSSPLPGVVARMRYIDLLGGQKPHLLIRVVNNLGAEIRVSYAPSTRFYVADALAGRPWATRLPFPVHVVERMDIYDWVSRNRFVTRHAYHHGYYDGVEREFRGFALVEQWDGETIATLGAGAAVPAPSNADPAFSLPPVHTRTWYHTGAWSDEARISTTLAREYYDEAHTGLGPEQIEAMRLVDTVLPATVLLADGRRIDYVLSPDEAREACRALKGRILRQEIYALDDGPTAGRPYSVTESNYTIEMLQPRGANRYASFFTHARETIGFQYERALYAVGGRRRADPRTSHTMVLETDAFANPLRTVTVDYHRRFPDADLSPEDQAIQALTQLVAVESRHTAPIDRDDSYRAPLPAESRSYELFKCRPRSRLPDITNLFKFDEMIALLAAADDGAHDLPFEDFAGRRTTGNHPYRRPIKRMRTLYRRDNLAGSLPLGQADPLGLVFESYKQALTPGLVTTIFSAKLDAPSLGAILRTDGAYVDPDSDGMFWTRSGQTLYSPDPAHPDPDFARAHFYTVRASRDAFGNVSHTEYDAYDLFQTAVTDPAGNIVRAGLDYRVLQPASVTDPNGNRSAVAFDALGLVAGTAIMGKASDALGDSLEGFAADLPPAEIDAFYEADDPHSRAPALLAGATARVVYDLHRFRASQAAHPDAPDQWQPSFAATIARETHLSYLAPGGQSALQIGFGYSDGFSRVIQQKAQAEPETRGGPLRWIASGWTIYNNKGKPARTYEPFFSALARRPQGFEFGIAVGVSDILIYDPLARLVAKLHPDHSWEKVLFDPWRQESWDRNDTVLIADPRADADMGGYFKRLPESDYLPTWYAQRCGGALGPAQRDAADKAALHAATPTIIHVDTHGRTFLTIAINRFKRSDAAPDEPPGEETSAIRLVLDVEGNQRESIDALGRLAFRYDYDMLGTRLRQASMEAGERWILNNVAGLSFRAWDSRGHGFRTEYDGLLRPVRAFVSGLDDAQPQKEVLVERSLYGDDPGNGLTREQARDANLLAHPYRLYDGAGIATNTAYDFKGNPLRITRQVLADYGSDTDWGALPPPALETGMFASSTTYDALNRPVAITTPDGSVYRPSYNETKLLDRIDIVLVGERTNTPFVTGIDYNAKGQRLRIAYGNATTTDLSYDPLTFRLIGMKTVRAADQALLQDLAYAFDPRGNITRIADSSQQTIYFANQVVTASNDYTYDSLYRLISAAGREHIGQARQPQTSWNDQGRTHLRQPGDGHAMRLYTEQYAYDAAGNFLRLAHRAADGAWSRRYAYQEASTLEPAAFSNRLSATTINGPVPTTEPYAYDAHGNMIAMPHLSLIAWDYRDRLAATARQAVSQGTPETTYYQYDSAGRRVRKVTVGPAGRRRAERLYLDGYEIYREFDGAGAEITLERQTLHVLDQARRIALVDTVTQGEPADRTIRYQMSNHLESATIELDPTGQVISYEEYYPYGGTSYQAGRSAAEISLKRYRFSARERDEESGFYYQGARYYAPWLGRWTSCDPAGAKGGMNLFAYAADSPTRFVDTTGLAPTIPAGGTPVSSLKKGLELLDQLASGENSFSTTEFFLGETGGQYRVFKLEGDLGGAIPKGYTAIAHSHPPGAMVTAEDVASTLSHAPEVGGVRTHLIARGGNHWSVIEAPKTGPIRMTSLDLQAGRVGESIELLRVGVGPHGTPLNLNSVIKVNEASGIKNTGELAKALEGSRPLSKVMASDAVWAAKAAEAGNAASKTAQVADEGNAVAKVVELGADAGKATETASGGGRVLRYLGYGGKTLKFAGELYMLGAVAYRFFLVGYHIREWQGREALKDLGHLATDIVPIDLLEEPAKNVYLFPTMLGDPDSVFEDHHDEDERIRQMNAAGYPHQLTSDEY